MKGSTTRAGRFYERKARYARRLKRSRGTHRNCYYHGQPDETLVHPNGPDVFEGSGTRQQSLNVLVKNPRHGVLHGGPPLGPIVSKVGYKHPPHIRWRPPGFQPPTHHQSNEVFGYHNRPCTYRGRKVSRLNGFQRQVAFASMKSYIYLQNTGHRAWPDDDPLQRMPQFSAEDFGWGDRVYGPPCH